MRCSRTECDEERRVSASMVFWDLFRFLTMDDCTIPFLVKHVRHQIFIEGVRFVETSEHIWREAGWKRPTLTAAARNNNGTTSHAWSRALEYDFSRLHVGQA
eukprot:TRINITY_DN2452_c0_g1_i2.p2 TRINITY_DN2452_c0_g1~~TRINITY_DN2452_c0_g1_i2.p2  ORF type:complete len:102 (+),score=10.67 TRINITY_DN2452_c0_g1_i2:309-614(+)